MINLLWRTDVHISDRSPGSRTDEWSETVLSKLREVGKIAFEHGCNAVLDGGDFFNDKKPIRTSHKLMSEIAKVHSEYPCPIYANVGNHDCRLAKYSLLDDGPLGSLFNSGVFKRCYDGYEAIFDDFSQRVRVVGVPYHGPKYDLERFRRIKSRGEDHLVVMGHVLASPQGGSMFENEDIVKYSDLLDLCPDASVFCFGHWHKDQGVTKIAENKWVVNIGSLTRGSLSQDDLNRKPGVVLMSFSKHRPPALQKIDLTISPPEQIFDIEKRMREEAKDVLIDEFIKQIKEEMSQETEKKDYHTIIKDLDIPNEVKELALEYLNSVV